MLGTRGHSLVGYFYLWYSSGILAHDDSHLSDKRRKKAKRWLGGQAVIEDAPSCQSVQVDDHFVVLVVPSVSASFSVVDAGMGFR